MYKRDSKIVSNIQNISNYIFEYDVFNSTLLYYLTDPRIEWENYEIINNEYRPDLIARDYYGSSSYTGLVVLMASISLTSYTKGTVIKLIPKITLDNILSNI